ncbi:MAG: DUF1834 family protein [Desulfobacteraceae bacterium]|nr:DUF1834 family protein [Desulfobacteraceae bacterium]
MAVVLSAIEDAIISRLKSEITGLKKVGTLSEFLKAEADQLSILAPAAFVTYVSGKYSNPDMNTTRYHRVMAFTILIVARSSISQEKLLHGSASRIGLYELIDDVVATLKGQDLGLGIRPLEPVSEDAIGGDQNTAIYGITFGTECRV